jgi:hypothetical protein
MSKPSAVTVVKGRARANELGEALITPSVSLSTGVILSNAAGAKSYLPVYRSAAQSAGGSEAFSASVTDDGTLTFFLESVPSPEIVREAGSAAAYLTGTSFALILNASGAGTRIPLKETREGGSIWRLSVKLSGNDLKQVRAALFDANPNVAIEVTQTVKLAARQTREFVDGNWSNAAIQQGLKDLFGGIPFDSASTYYGMASGSDPDFSNQYIVLNCTYRAQVPAPPLPGYVQWQVNWQNRAYNYYQDNQDRTRIFYLPDRFEFAKGPAGAPTVSLLQFTLPEGPVTVERTRATFRVYGRQIVDFNRIQNAAQSLKDKVGGAPQMVSLQDAHHAKMTFTQFLPNAQATASDPAVQANAVIDLSAGLRNELDLSFAQFRALWAAIFSGAPENPLFRGWVDVELSDGKYKDRIDFNGRLPKEQETPFFDDILDTSAEKIYPAQFKVKTFNKAFEGEPAVLEIELIFTGGKTVTLSPEKLESQIQVERSIRDIVIGKQSPDKYPYKLRVVRDDGSIACCKGEAKSDTPTLWLTLKQISDCTDDCS